MTASRSIQSAEIGANLCATRIHRLGEERHGPELTAAALERTKKGNLITEILADDPHLGPFVGHDLPCKENGFDIEGIAARGDRIWLGLRGPVLVGWAFLIELRVTASKSGTLELAKIGDKERRYRKHLLKMDGLGIRDLVFWDDDLLILAGPTMDLTGRLGDVLDQKDNSLNEPGEGTLERLLALPVDPDGDKAEGLAIYHCLGEEALLVLYDSPSERRRPAAHAVYGDVFRLPRRTAG